MKYLLRKIIAESSKTTEIDEKKKSRGKKKASHMATVDADPEDDDCDMENMDQW